MQTVRIEPSSEEIYERNELWQHELRLLSRQDFQLGSFFSFFFIMSRKCQIHYFHGQSFINLRHGALLNKSFQKFPILQLYIFLHGLLIS